MLKLKSFLLMPTLISAVCSALVACGTKGPLYIPEQRYPAGAAKPAVDMNKDINKLETEKASPAPSNQTQPTIKE